MNKAHYIRMGAALLTILCLFSCAREQGVPMPVPLPEASPDDAIQSISLSPAETDMGVGEQLNFTIYCTPDGLVPALVNWSSSNPEVASVDAAGVVSAHAPGVVRIKASAGNQADSAVVNVYERLIPATGVRLSRREVGLRQGRSFKAQATLLPDNTTEKNTFSWTSSQESIATVDNGVITAVGVGEAVIRVFHKALKDSIRVTVSEEVTFRDISGIWTLKAPLDPAPSWAWDEGRNVIGAQESVRLGSCDSYYHYLSVVHADKFDGIEKAADSLTALLEATEADGEDASLLLKKGSADTLVYTYPQPGNAVAYVLGVDEDLGLTGEYALLRFKTRAPEPIPATGIVFCQGDAPVSQLSLQEGQHLESLYARFEPLYCTDNWQEIRFASSDGFLLSASSQAGSCTLDGRFKGETTVTASFGTLTATLPVTVTRPADDWTDCSEQWEGQFGTVSLWGFDTFGFTLNSCSSPMHVALMIPLEEIGESLVYAYFKQQKAQVQKTLASDATGNLPHVVAAFGNSSREAYCVFVYGIGADGKSFDGKYAIYYYTPSK